MEDVLFYDLRAVNARHEREFVDALERVNRTGRYLLGAEATRFEGEFAVAVGCAHAVAVGSGLDALRLVLESWITLGRLRPGDEVVVPGNSFVASALAVTQAGLIPRLADVARATRNLDAATLPAAVTPRTRAVMFVHLYGSTAGVEGIRQACASTDLLLIEDAAQAHGARTASGAAGAIGDAGAFSFYPGKNLGALADAGCVVTNDRHLAERVRVLANYGSHEKYVHEFAGTNSRMDEFNAAALSVRLRHLERDNEIRRAIAARYVAGIQNPLITLPSMPENPMSHVWHQFVVECDHRPSLLTHLASRKVGCLIHYPVAIHRQPPYVDAAVAAGGLPQVEALCAHVLSLPISPVMPDGDVERVIAAMNEYRGA